MMTIIIAVAAALIAAGVTWLATRSVYGTKLESQTILHQTELSVQEKVLRQEIETLKEVHKNEKENADKMAKQAQENYEQALKQMKETVASECIRAVYRLLKPMVLL